MQEESETNLQPEEADEQSESQHASEFDQALEGAFDGTQNATEDSGTIDERLAEANREVLRAKAEMENFRKRMQRESDQLLKYSNMPLIRDLLEVMDNLNRAVDAADDDAASNSALKAGVEMVSQQLVGVLGKYGCSKVEALGKTFDPNVHEAIAQMPSEEYESGTVMQEVAVGYVLHDRVVRPTHVIVSSGAAG